MFFVILPQASLSRTIFSILKLVLLVLIFPINRSRFKSRERDAKFIVLRERVILNSEMANEHSLKREPVPLIISDCRCRIKENVFILKLQPSSNVDVPSEGEMVFM